MLYSEDRVENAVDEHEGTVDLRAVIFKQSKERAAENVKNARQKVSDIGLLSAKKTIRVDQNLYGSRCLQNIQL